MRGNGRAGKTRRGWDEGSVEQLPSGKFRAVVSAGYDPATGKRRKVAETSDTKKAALAWVRERLAERDKGMLSSAGKMRVGQWLERWLGDKRDQVEPKTWKWYESNVRRHLAEVLGTVQLSKLTVQEVGAAFEQLRVWEVSKRDHHGAMTTLRAALKEAVAQHLIHQHLANGVVVAGAALKEAVAQHLIPLNPALGIRKPKVDRPEQ